MILKILLLAAAIFSGVCLLFFVIPPLLTAMVGGPFIYKEPEQYNYKESELYDSDPNSTWNKQLKGIN